MIGKPEFIVDERVVWTSLSRNKNAVHILKENIDKVKWNDLTNNENPDAIALFYNNLDELDEVDEGEPNDLCVFVSIVFNKPWDDDSDNGDEEEDEADEDEGDNELAEVNKPLLVLDSIKW